MANIGLLVKGMQLFGKSVSVRGLVASNNPVTQISQRMAVKLGLTEFRPVYVTDDYTSRGKLKWKISTVPLLISSPEEGGSKKMIVFPVVNCSINDAWWELILGRDSWKNDCNFLNVATNVRGFEPTPGPSYAEGGYFMGHNVRLCGPDEVPQNEFYEYPCVDSDAISRLAIHKANRQLFVVFADSETVHQYSDLPLELETQIETKNGVSKTEVMAAVKQACPETVIDAFPGDTALLCLDLKKHHTFEGLEVEMTREESLELMDREHNKRNIKK